MASKLSRLAQLGSLSTRVGGSYLGQRITGLFQGEEERLQEGMAADAKLQGIDTEEALKRATARLPLGRIATPEEIANAVVFLASPKASYITGAIVAMDGAVTPMV